MQEIASRVVGGTELSIVSDNLPRQIPSLCVTIKIEITFDHVPPDCSILERELFNASFQNAIEQTKCPPVMPPCLCDVRNIQLNDSNIHRFVPGNIYLPGAFIVRESLGKIAERFMSEADIHKYQS